MKQISDVPNPWLADKLAMGSGFYGNKHVGRTRHEPDHPRPEVPAQALQGKRYSMTLFFTSTKTERRGFGLFFV